MVRSHGRRSGLSEVDRFKADEVTTNKADADALIRQGVPWSVSPEATHYPHAVGFSIQDIVSATFVSDPRNAALGGSHQNSRYYSGHIMGAPRPMTINGQLHVFAENITSAENPQNGEATTLSVADTNAQKFSKQYQFPDYSSGINGVNSDGHEADPQPLYVPERGLWYFFIATQAGDGWETQVVETEDWETFNARNDVGTIVEESHTAVRRLGDTFYIFWGPGGGNVRVKTTSLKDFPGGWSAGTKVYDSTDTTFFDPMRVDDGWVAANTVGQWTGPVELLSTTQQEFPGGWTYQRDVISPGDGSSPDESWDTAGYRNPRWYVGKGNAPMLFVPGSSNGTTSDSTTGIWRMGHSSPETASETIREPTLNIDNDADTSNASAWDTIAGTRVVQDGAVLDNVFCRMVYGLTTDNADGTIALRVRDTTDGQTLAEVSLSGTGVGMRDSQWQGPFDISFGTNNEFSHNIELQAQVNNNSYTGTVLSSFASSVLFKTPPGRF